MATKADQWSDPQTRISFGRDVAVAAQLQGIPLSSLAKNTFTPPELLWEILEGIARLTDEQVDKICLELKLGQYVLFEQYPHNTARVQCLAQKIPKERNILTKFDVIAQPTKDMEGVEVMKLGLTDAQLSAPERRDAFAANLRQCLQLLEMKPESIALRAEFTNEQVNAILRSGFALTNEAITAICHEIGLSASDMLTDYVSDGERLQKLQWKLQQAGKLSAPSADDGSPEAEGADQARIPCAAQPFTEGSMPSWDDGDFIATFTNGDTFDLRNKQLRPSICQRLRTVNPYKSLVELLRNTDGMENKNPSWFNNAEDSKVLIYGTQLESFAEAVDASVYWLLTGEADPNGPTEEEPAGEYPEPDGEEPTEEPATTDSPVDDELVETLDTTMGEDIAELYGGHTGEANNPPTHQRDGEDAMEDDEANDADMAETSRELTWNDDVAITSDGRSFDIKTKDMRAMIIGRIRTLLRGKDMKIVKLFENAGMSEKPSGWINGVERGSSRIKQAEFLALCEALDVEPYDVLDGSAIPITASAGRGKVVEKVISIPAITEAEVQEYFRQQVLNKGTKLAEGIEIGELLDLAANPQSADWVEAFLTLTANGANVKKDIEALKKAFTSKHPILRIIMLRAIADAVS
jgi:DNA-binding Xre family transcriptional regulator